MKANKFAKNDEGVSAVIGVILMVAITVILAAVIAAFVFGMVGGVNQKKNPAFTVKRISNGEVQLTLQDMGGAKTIVGLKVTQPQSITDITKVGATWDYLETTSTTDGGIKVGDTISIKHATNLAGTVHIVGTSMVDGASQVVVDTNA